MYGNETLQDIPSPLTGTLLSDVSPGSIAAPEAVLASAPDRRHHGPPPHVDPFDTVVIVRADRRCPGVTRRRFAIADIW